MAILNLTGDVVIYGLSIKIGAPTVSANKQTITIPYVGTSDPSSSDVTLAKYQYSTDNGVSYKNMKPLSSADISGLSFSPLRTNLVFNWDAKKDLGDNLYNRPLRVLLQASAFGILSAEVTKYYTFPRILVNPVNEQSKKAFPDSYEGIQGNDFIANKLPKSNG